MQDLFHFIKYILQREENSSVSSNLDLLANDIVGRSDQIKGKIGQSFGSLSNKGPLYVARNNFAIDLGSKLYDTSCI